jgi:hypothetical protein
MRSEPLLIVGGIALVLAVVCAIGLNVTHTPVSMVEAILTAAVPIIGLVLTGRTQTFSQKTTENLVANALSIIPPPVAETRELAQTLVKDAK